MSSPENLDPSALQVIDTLRDSGLDPARCLVHSGSALALCGLRATRDLDVLVEPSYFAEISETGKTPGGVALVETGTIPGRKRLVSAEEPNNDLLPIDASTFSRLGKNRRFDYYFQWADEFECALGVLKVRPLLHILHQKNSNATGRHRDRIDAQLIEGFLQRPENLSRY